jgi:spore coat polysaccharide biosynthesis predicted glycosyltransferase SpsG
LNKKLIFRCDAGSAPEIGTGHVTRSKTIANSLVEKGFLLPNDIYFYTRSDIDYDLGESHLCKSGYEYQVFPNSQLEANSISEINILKNSSASLILMDRLQTTENFVRAISSSGKKIVTFDDYGSGRIHADLAINAIFDDIDYSENLKKGYEYLVLSQPTYFPVPIKKNVEKIVATFGGLDARNLCKFFLENSSCIPESCSVDVILGKCDKSLVNDYLAYIEAKKNTDKFQLHVFPPNYHNIIAGADLAITSGGLSIFEFLAYGVPTIGLPQYKHQHRTIKKLEDAGIGLLGSNGMILLDEMFELALNKMLNNFSLRKSMAMKARASIDGNGIDRIVNLLIDKFPENFYA